jgi:alcohol dehydrogenase class IV
MQNELITFRTAGSILFGNNAIERLGGIAGQMGVQRALIVTDKGIVKSGLLDRLTQCIAGIEHAVYDDIDHTPSFETIRRCSRFAQEGRFDLVIGFGGGSAMDAAKAVSIMVTNPGKIEDYLGSDKVRVPALPKILITTTSGTGSEVTIFAMLGQRDKPPYSIDGIYDKHCLPEVAIVDPTLTLGVPPSLTANTGIDALSHATECYVNIKSGFHNKPLALEAVRLTSRNLERATADGANLEARYHMAAGSLLAGMAFNQSGSGIAHGLGEAFQVEYNIQHGTAIGIVLPHVMSFNLTEAPALYAELARAMGIAGEGLPESALAEKSAERMREIIGHIGLPKRLSEVGIPERELERIAKTALELSPGLFKKNLRPVGEKDVLHLLKEAY